MPFEIVRNDITNMQVDAIVNTANPKPVVGLGTDSRIHEKAGPRLLQARQRIGELAVGTAAITPAFDLGAKYVIHTVGPVWQGGEFGEAQLLRNCYDASLRLALEHGCQSVAFPLISAGTYGFPKDQALQIAIAAFSSFLLEHSMQIYLVVFNGEVHRLSEKLFWRVASYIDQHYVDRWEKATFAADREVQRRRQQAMAMPMGQKAAVAPQHAASLEEMLKKEDAGFSETLLRYIDKAGLKDSQIYKKANLSKQHFSKIRNQRQYKPTKATALALAIALELDVPQTEDLIGRAGYALTNSSKFDLIIRYFIQQRNYNIVEINMALYEFDQPLLGGREV